jgi:predicted nucleic acid-binding protein
MTFWDSSAIVPLLCPQPASPALVALRDGDEAIQVWAWTPVECLSALRRLEREGRLDAGDLREGRRKLAAMRTACSELADLEAVAERAERCLMLHPLRAADAGQLAAALLLAERLARPVPFVTLDRQLAEAARREGFVVLGDGVVPSAHERSRGQRPTARGRSDAQPSPYR